MKFNLKISYDFLEKIDLEYQKYIDCIFSLLTNEIIDEVTFINGIMKADLEVESYMKLIILKRKYIDYNSFSFSNLVNNKIDILVYGAILESFSNNSYYYHLLDGLLTSRIKSNASYNMRFPVTCKKMIIVE